MIRSSTGRKEVSIEALKKEIELGKDIFVRFVYAKKFLKIDGFAEVVQPSGKKVDTVLCEDGFSYRPFDIMEVRIANNL